MQLVVELLRVIELFLFQVGLNYFVVRGEGYASTNELKHFLFEYIFNGDSFKWRVSVRLFGQLLGMMSVY